MCDFPAGTFLVRLGITQQEVWAFGIAVFMVTFARLLRIIASPRAAAYGKLDRCISVTSTATPSLLGRLDVRPTALSKDVNCGKPEQPDAMTPTATSDARTSASQSDTETASDIQDMTCSSSECFDHDHEASHEPIDVAEWKEAASRLVAAFNAVHFYSDFAEDDLPLDREEEKTVEHSLSHDELVRQVFRSYSDFLG
jgi:hypothetical protein